MSSRLVTGVWLFAKVAQGDALFTSAPSQALETREKFVVVPFERFIDVELPAEVSSQHVVAVSGTCNLARCVCGEMLWAAAASWRAESKLLSSCELRIPFHLRYQLATTCSSNALECRGFSSLTSPDVVLRCAGTAATAGPRRLTLPAVRPTPPTDMSVPTGNLGGVLVVWSVTLLFTWGGSALLVWIACAHRRKQVPRRASGGVRR